MRRALRVLVFGLGGLLAALGVALLALWLVALALSGGWQRERLRAELETALEGALADAGIPARVRLGALDGPLYPEFALRELALELDGSTPLRVESLALRFDLSRVWAERRVIVEALEIGGAELALARDPERGWIWERIGPLGDSALELELRELSVSDARFAVEPAQGEPSTRLAGSFDAAFSNVTVPRVGSPSWPERATASLRVEPGTLAGRALHRANLELRLAGTLLALEPSRLDSEFGVAELSGETDLAGWLDPAQPGTFRLQGSAERLDLGVLLARPELAGSLGFSIRLEASHRPGDPLRESRGEARIELAPSQLGGLRIDAGELKGRFADGAWQLRSARLETNAAELRASGSGDTEGMTALEVALEIADLRALAAIAGADLGGRASLHAKLAGPFREPTGSVEIDARELRAAGVAVGALRTRVASAGRDRFELEPFLVDGPLAHVEGEGPIVFHWQSGRLALERADLRLPELRALRVRGSFEASGAHELRAELEGLDLARASERLGVALPVGGVLDGEWVARGSLPRPDLRGALRWSAPELEKLSAAPLAIDFEARSGALRVDLRLAGTERELLAGRVQMPWSAGFDPRRALESPRTVATVSSEDLDLALLGTLFPETLRGIEGRARVRAELRGGAPEPSLEGEARVTGASLDSPALGRPVGPLEAQLRFTRDAIEIESLRLEGEGEGHAILRGEVLLADLVPLGADLELELHGFPIRRGTTLHAALDGSASIAGRFDSLAANGELVARGLHYSLAYDTDPLMDEIVVRRGPKPPPDPVRTSPQRSQVWSGASIDLRVEVPPDSRVSGDGADVAIGGRLRARKFPSRPTLLFGRIETLSGNYRVRGKTFTVERGGVDFSGRSDLDPDLDLRAHHRVRDIAIFALITGRASAPVLRLESEPAYPEHDVLALLLFGRTRQELDSAQAGALQSVLAGTAGGAALAELSEQLDVPLPIDSLEVESSESANAATIRVGRYLTDDILIHYGQDFGGDGASDVRVDWKVAPRWTIESGASTRGDSYVDLFWTFDY